jgi:O-antigen/teichoic acid export membrane protein
MAGATGQMLRHAMIFGLAPVLQKLVGMVLLPFYTHYLTTADYGEIEILTVLTGLFGLALRLELRPGYMRAWLTAADTGARAALFRGALRLIGVLAAAGTLLFLLVSGPLAARLVGHPLSLAYRGVLAVGLFCDVLGMVFAATLQARLRSREMVVLSVATFALNASVTVACVVGLRLGAFGFFIGGAAGSTANLCGMVFLTLPLLRAHPTEPARIAALVRYSLPLLGAASLYFIVRNADRVAVSQLLSVSELGIYGMGWTLANMLMTFVLLPMQSSFEVWRYKLHADPAQHGEMAEVFRLVMLVMATGALGLNTFAADAFTLLADARFDATLGILPLLTTAVVLQGGYSIISSAFYVTEATGQWLRIFAVGAAAQVAGSMLFIPPFGLYGAAVGAIVANTLLYAGAAAWGRRLWPVPYRHGMAVALTLVTLGLSLARRAMPTTALDVAVGMDGATLALFVAALFLLRIVTPADIALLHRAVLSRRATQAGAPLG